MTIKTIFASPTYAADLFSEFKAMFSDGVCTGLGVAAHGTPNLSVDVVAGSGMKSGMFLISDAQVNVVIGANSSGYNRIDVIAADMDNIALVVAQGTPNSAPTPPTLTGNKIALAQVLVGNNVTVINTGNITDVRVPSYQSNNLAYAQSFGLGADAAVCTDVHALPASSGSGFYNIASGCANLPPGETAGTLIHIGRDGRPTDIFQGYASNTFWFESYGSGGWSEWSNAMTAMPSTLPMKNSAVTGSIITFALSCPDGYSPFKTTSGVSGVPTSKGQLDYSCGYVLVSGNYRTLVIVSRTTGIVHTNVTTDSSTWIGWNAYTAVPAT